jgi:imidazolonepropionase
MGDLLTEASILSVYEKLSSAETLAGLTFRAASALSLSDRGSLGTGMKADFIAFPADDYRDILYYQGQLRPAIIWKNGIKYENN